MKTVINYKNLDSTPSLKVYISKKTDSLVKYVSRLDKTGSAQLDLELERTTKHHHKGQVFQVSAHLKLPRKIIRASARGFDIRTALDLAKDTLAGELKRYKDRLSRPVRR